MNFSMLTSLDALEFLLFKAALFCVFLHNMKRFVSAKLKSK
jgi:hypothetical protein